MVVYNRLSTIVCQGKRHASSVFLMAACRLMVFILSATAVSGRVGLEVWVGGFIQFIYVLVLSLVARYENHLKKGFPFPVIRLMLACISLLDGIVMASLTSAVWLLAGLGGAVLTYIGQQYIRGD